ncbi:sensor histidine kinase [Actinocrispum wychmicini]|nr:sensor histidine kinase [Actinocrispum wychmicini]
MRRPWWHYLAGVASAIYLLGGMVWAVVGSAQDFGWLTASGMFVTHVVALGCGVLALRRVGEPSVLLPVAVAAGIGAEALHVYSGIALLYFAVSVAPYRMRPLPAFLLTAVAIAGFVWLSYLDAMPASALFGVAFGMMWVEFFSAILNQLGVARRQAAALAEAKMLAERQRLAREIHDVLAHSLSAQVVHLEGTRMLLENGYSREQALDRVIQAGDLARVGLEETKRAVAALRGDQTPLADQLESLATEFRGLTGRPCSVEVRGDPDEMAAETRLAVLRTVQEALTNVRKHSPGASVTVVLKLVNGWCSLEVVDTGGDSAEPTGTGYGLVGMRERAELIGGSLEAGPTGGGFRVGLRVPA